VANVGDSRCILIQRTTTTTKDQAAGLEQAVAKLSLKESPQSGSGSDEPAVTKTSTTYSVKAMSHDLKRAEEEQARIEKAGRSFAEVCKMVRVVIRKVNYSG
jgi:serine/threonine protein phosphatase PrpC